MSVIELQQVTKSFAQQTVLSAFDLTINEGEMVAIIGPSGKGKTTILNMIGLITTPDTGRLTLFDYTNPPIHSKTAMLLRRHKIGYLFQSFGLVDEETVEWNLQLALTYKPLTKQQKRDMIDEQLQLFGLHSLRDKKVYQLSGGEQQRIALIRLTLQDPDLILADEPTASLDQANAMSILHYLQQLNHQGKTVVVVTHNEAILPFFSKIISL